MQKKTILLIFSLMLLVHHKLKAENIVYPENLRSIVDITKPPYSADNNGKTDCTAVLIRAIDDIIKPDRQALRETIRITKERHEHVFRADQLSFKQRQHILQKNPKAVIGFERCSGTFPYHNAPSKILYFPNGVYLVSDTISYTFRDLQNASGMEFNRRIHFQGQSEEGAIIKLRDNTPCFGKGFIKPVVSFMRGKRSNVAMQNTFENLTIDVGRGNPGAIGLLFFANNTGAVRHVTIRSSDPEYAGKSGLAVTTFNSSCALIKHVTVDGFDCGIEISQHRLYTVLEHITLRNQRVTGFHLKDHNVAVRRLSSHNTVSAVRIEGTKATMALLDSQFSGGNSATPAIDMRGGFLFARNIDTDGYGLALKQPSGKVAVEPRIDEYISHRYPVLFPDQVQESLNLPIEETPDIPWEQDMSQWVGVNEFGARGDGLNDDTLAIQQTMDAGKAVVYFHPGTYLINGTVIIPAHVQRVNFMYSDLVAGEDLQNKQGQGTFRVSGESEKPLIIEDLFAFELYFGAHYLIDHACRRTVVLSDLHTQVGAMYKNSVSGGKVFIENVCTTDQFEPYRNCFSFTGQQVWARQLNPERANPEVLNQGSKLWVLGFKTEKSGTAFYTTRGGYTEVLGGIFNISRSADSHPMIVNDDSNVSIFASTTDHRNIPIEYNKRWFIEEKCSGITKGLAWDKFPKRDEQLIVVPLYTSHAKGVKNTEKSNK